MKKSRIVGSSESSLRPSRPGYGGSWTGALQILCIAVALAIATPSAPAAEAQAAAADLMELDLDSLANVKVTVSGAKEETVLSSASVVSVVDRRMIEDYNFPTVSAAVETLAGVGMSRSYLKAGVTTIRGVLQDNYANKVLVMINNVPTWNAVTGEGELDRVNINDVERIEVLRGPASVIYGSQAYSGAINLVLREARPGEMHGGVHGGWGNNGGWDAGGSFRYATSNGWQVVASVNHLEGTRHYYKFRDQAGVTGTVKDFLDNQNATLSLSYKQHNFLFNGYQQDEGYFGVTPHFSAGAGVPHEVEGFLTAYTLRQAWTDKLETDLTAFYDWNQRNLSRRADDSQRANVLGWRAGGNLRNRYAVTDNWQLELGGDYEFRKSLEYQNYNTLTGAVLDENNMTDQHVSEFSIYGQTDYQWKSLKFVAGGRFTHNELTGDNFSPRATIVWQINPHHALKLMGGESFRSPSLFESYFIPAAKTVFGNPGLKPEKNDTLELVYQYSQGRFFGQAGVYQAWYKDKIFRNRGDFAGFKNVSYYDNGEAFTAQGLELELKYLRPEWVDVFLNFDYVHGDDGDEVPGTDHYNFKYVPDFTVSGGLHKRFGNFDASVMANYVDCTRGASAKVDAFTIMDATLAYRHRVKKVEFKHCVAVRNLLDDEALVPEYVAHSATGVQALPIIVPGRSVYYSLNVSF